MAKAHITNLANDAEAFLTGRQYQRALALVQSALAQAGGDPATDTVRLRLIEGECLAFLGEQRRALEICGPLLETLGVSSEHALYARGSLIMGIAQFYLGQTAEALENARIALYAYKRAGDTDGACRSLNWLGNIHFDRSELADAVRAYEQCIALADTAERPRWVAVGRYNLGKAFALCGEIPKALATLTDNREALAQMSDPLNVMRSDLLTAFVRIQDGDYAGARAALFALESAVFDSPHLREQGAWCEYMGELELREGNLKAAAEQLARGIAIGSGPSRDESVVGQSRRLLAEVRLAAGDFPEAIAECHRALESVRRVGERFEEGVIYRLLGEAHHRLDQNPEARAAFKQSVDLLRTIGARLEWAKSCLAAGQSTVFSRRERYAFLAEAERLFGETGVERWIEEARGAAQDLLQGRVGEIRARATDTVGSALFISADSRTRDTLKLADRLARVDIAILITGETGVGKDQLSRYVHAQSPRRDGPFVPIDLSCIPESLWESEVFGHRKGAFTGATADKIGLMESANGGTVFLNEIGNLPLPFQAKILELLDSQRIRPVGQTEPLTLDVRFIAATNENLRAAVAAGRFRQDLYFRLAGAPLHLLPLRERRGDIIPLIRHFLVEYGVPVSDLSCLDMQLWVERAYNGHWEGNVRQLRSFIHRLVAIAERPSDPEFAEWAMRLLEQIDIIHEPNVGARVSREALRAALERNVWNQRAAARDLGITEGGVRHLMRRWDVARPKAA